MHTSITRHGYDKARVRVWPQNVKPNHRILQTQQVCDQYTSSKLHRFILYPRFKIVSFPDTVQFPLTLTSLIYLIL